MEILLWTGIGLAIGLGILGGLALTYLSWRDEVVKDTRDRFLERRRRNEN